MILTHNDILEEIKNGNIIISPLDKVSVGPASVDLTVGETFRVFNKMQKSIEVKEQTDFKSITEKIIVKDKYTIKPGQLILGMTREIITISNNIVGWLNSRSRFARLGLAVHITAPFIQPGESGRQVLEIYNASPNDLDITPGEKLCQIIFQYCKGSAKYTGIFQNQDL